MISYVCFCSDLCGLMDIVTVI